MSFTHDDAALAETYHRVSELQFERGKQLAERLDLDSSKRVLDVGCGTGRLTQWMADRCAYVLGIDPVEERIGVARASEGKAHFHVTRAEDLSAFEDASFDGVCMSSVLHWVEDKEKALNEAHRVLKPGGRLAVTTMPNELARASTLRRTLESLDVEASRLTFAKPGLTTTEHVELLRATHGLELLELHVTPDEQLHANGEALVTFIEASAFGTFLKPVPELRRAELRSALVKAFDAQATASGIVLQTWTLVLVAQRNPLLSRPAPPT